MSVGNFVAKTVLVESANQFSLQELSRTQYRLKYFSNPYRPSDPLEKPYTIKAVTSSTESSKRCRFITINALSRS